MKSSRLELRLEEADLESARRLAREQGTSVSSVVRLLIRSASNVRGDGIPAIVLDKRTFAKYVRNVRALGHLYNQAVHALNTLAKIACEEGVEPLDLTEALGQVSWQLNAVQSEAESIRTQAAELTGRPAVFE